MKLLLSSTLVLMLLLGSGLVYTYSKLSNLYPEIESLKIRNGKLSKKNTNLSKKNKNLSQQNKKYKANRKNMRSRYKQRRARLTTQKLERANKKLIAGASKMVPFAAIPVIVAATSYDVKEYCDDINEMERFEYELFGEASPTNVDDKICGIDVEAELQQSANEINNLYENILIQAQKEHQQRKDYWHKTYNNAEKEVVNKGYDIQSDFRESLENTAKYLSEENEKTSQFWIDVFK